MTAESSFTLPLSTRAREVVDAARRMLEESGWEAVTMHKLASALGIQAPSLYKHLANREALRVALITDGLTEMGEQLHSATTSVNDLLSTYREYAVANPHLYRLCTTGPLPRAELPAGLEDWAGTPFYTVTNDPYRSQALWSYAHGMVILEIDGRYPPGSDLDQTWRIGASAFALAAPAQDAR